MRRETGLVGLKAAAPTLYWIIQVPDRDAIERELGKLQKTRRKAARAWRDAGGYIYVEFGRSDPAPPHLRQAVEAATDAYYRRCAELLPDGSRSRFAERLRTGDAGSIDEAIEFLEFDPFSRWSGYVKQRVMTILGQMELDEEQKERLRHSVLATLSRGRRQEFKTTRRFARKLNSPEFRDALRSLVPSTTDEETRWRASMILGLCERDA